MAKQKINNKIKYIFVLSAFCQGVSHAGGIQTLELDAISVEGQGDELPGVVESATVGTVTAEQLKNRPLARTGELLETVPGLIVSQHSGEGKANQYYLRGFNLDHGTDFATFVDNVPVNLVTHAHGQGWTDTNFIIPELIENIQYKKGVYYAEEGDFSAAGAARLYYANKLKRGIAKVESGEYGYYRAMVADSAKVDGGDFLYAFDISQYNGPWVIPQEFDKKNIMFRYSKGDRDNGFTLAALSYKGDWTATDQIPKRAVDSGLISQWGYIDPTDGGAAKRTSLSADWRQTGDTSSIKANVYAFEYAMDLYSNFTYYVDDPFYVDGRNNGNQFQQTDDRRVYGGATSYNFFAPIAGFDSENEIGLQVRHDNISNVGIYNTKARQRLKTIREDAVKQTSISLYGKTDIQWTAGVRSIVGIRLDHFRYDVNSNIAANSGKANDTLVSPKYSMIFGPWKQTEYFFNVGRGFHSNDGRGSTSKVDPVSGGSVDPVNPLVPATGADIGLRTAIIPKTQASLSFWALDIDSELLFVGDGGVTEATRPSRRTGVEASIYYRPVSALIIDADAAYSRGRFNDNDPDGEGKYIDGSVEGVASLGISYEPTKKISTGLRVRYFGPRPLTPDNSVRSDSTKIVNLQLGYQLTQQVKATLDIINLLNSDDHSIDYYYESQLKNEAAPVQDIHFHPEEPRMVRASLSATF